MLHANKNLLHPNVGASLAPFSVTPFKLTGPNFQCVMKPFQSLVSRSALFHQWRILFSFFLSLLRRLLFSLESYTALGLFTASSVALLVHKFTLILSHRPLGFAFIFLWPFMFGFDLGTLILLYHMLSSGNKIWRLFGYIVCLIIISCSGAFVSLFLETNTPANWGRSVEVYNS